VVEGNVVHRLERAQVGRQCSVGQWAINVVGVKVRKGNCVEAVFTVSEENRLCHRLSWESQGSYRLQ